MAIDDLHDFVYVDVHSVAILMPTDPGIGNKS